MFSDLTRLTIAKELTDLFKSESVNSNRSSISHKDSVNGRLDNLNSKPEIPSGISPKKVEKTPKRAVRPTKPADKKVLTKSLSKLSGNKFKTGNRKVNRKVNSKN